MIAADNETCGGVVINQTNVTCPEVLACIAALPTGAPAIAGDLVLGSDNEFHALPADHATVLAACPATGPTVAPTSEGHYYYTSTRGEKWQWIYGDSAPFVCGKFYSTYNIQSAITYNGGGAIHHTFVAFRNGVVHVDWSFSTSAAAPTYADVFAAITKNGVSAFGMDRSTAGTAGWNAAQCVSATFSVAAGDVIGFFGRNVSTSSSYTGARSVTYQE